MHRGQDRRRPAPVGRGAAGEGADGGLKVDGVRLRAKRWELARKLEVERRDLATTGCAGRCSVWV